MGCGSSKLDKEEVPSRTEEIPKPEEREYDLPSEEEKGIIVIEEVKKVDEEKSKEREEPLESPSFRFYFTDMAPYDSDDDGSVKIIQEISNEKLAMVSEGDENKGKHERGASHESLSSTTSNEESDSKLVNKDRGGRFKALTTAPSQVFSFLTVRK